MDPYLECLRKYAVFSGRARREEYWMFLLVSVVIAFVLGFMDGALGLLDPASGYGILSSLYGLAVLIPGIAVSVRRLHDTGHRGWWLLIGFVPVLGILVLLYFMARDSDPANNEYGPNPKDAATGKDFLSILEMDEEPVEGRDRQEPR